MQRTSITLITFKFQVKVKGFSILIKMLKKKKETIIKNNERTGFRETVPTDNHDKVYYSKSQNCSYT